VRNREVAFKLPLCLCALIAVDAIAAPGVPAMLVLCAA
jgi:hypothetical protein